MFLTSDSSFLSCTMHYATIINITKTFMALSDLASCCDDDVNNWQWIGTRTKTVAWAAIFPDFVYFLGLPSLLHCTTCHDVTHTPWNLWNLSPSNFCYDVSSFNPLPTALYCCRPGRHSTVLVTYDHNHLFNCLFYFCARVSLRLLIIVFVSVHTMGVILCTSSLITGFLTLLILPIWLPCSQLLPHLVSSCFRGGRS